ncbi:hypothetical protein Q5P01_023557 [Channa striata]|uniref:5-hydroxytryptamine receptor 3A-like n=1 Tax=Channa striata TaxID=64152 RepID=A0AA88JAA9_CHASR|nr:hypothetical protein Q5P01_023557 [Channa striata]
MMLVGLVCLLVVTAAESSDNVCSYQDVLKYLNLTKDNGLFSMTRPVKDYTHTTVVTLEVVLYAILDVVKIDQTFIPYVWIFLIWNNEYISWNPDDFCGIKNISIPNEVLWRPDLTIEEMIEKDKAPPSPLLIISNTGNVIVQNDQVLVSTCRMHVYKFPFDIQSCTLSFKSVVHSVEEIRLVHKASSADVTRWSREVMRTQYEWLFINMTVTNKTVTAFNVQQDVIIFTINMKRRPVLYIVNFILPVLFFLCLDLSSFLISDSGGEKLSFKITVLLAVTVMQLILNEILPSSSNKIPLIAVYCIGIFSLMMISLLETIVVKYLIEKDFASEDNEGDRDHSLSEDGNKQDKSKLHNCDAEEKKTARGMWICDVTSDEKAAELLKKEEDQTFIPYVWILKSWQNEYISWNPEEFCGIESVGVPAEIMWKPDITIEEMTEKDKAPPAPYLTITHDGFVEVTNDQVLVSTCMMYVYQFPFDIQICNLTFKSVVHSVENIILHENANSSVATEASREVMRTQLEWLFVGMNITNKTVKNFGFEQSAVVYTITIRRRSTLYIVNFILPILFFLCLDLSSFLISERGGEKLSFKVTVLLAVTVMQLILNEILPSTSNKIPLIALYCVGVFGLMLLSLLETIVVMYLIEKDKEEDKDQDCGDKQSKCTFAGSSENLSDDLREVLKTLLLILHSQKEQEKSGYWTNVAKKINKVFFIFYVIVATLFIVCMFFSWNKA